jgi:hypothetical protein
MTLIALLGAKVLLFLYLWLLSAIVASYLSDRKGFGEKPGLVTGLLVSVLAPVIWLLMPARADSRWKLHGPVGSGGGQTVASARADREAKDAGGGG